jgi:hypothetical protein
MDQVFSFFFYSFSYAGSVDQVIYSYKNGPSLSLSIAIEREGERLGSFIA